MTEQYTRQQTLQQRRAAHAWACVEQVPASIQKKYGSLVRGLPALVQSDGLGQTLAFLKAKAGGNADKEHMVAYNHIADWVSTELQADGDLLTWLLGRSTADYRRATAEALAYLNWLKRFAEAKGWQEEGQ
ncbi:MAG: type III-B CRISPR module-associated protein Cmr5 [Chloroflexota bacterium]|nr:MAG: type III-B CRISPR module-associated protein Cmr5 [Chloroflexota bacterium]